MKQLEIGRKRFSVCPSAWPRRTTQLRALVDGIKDYFYVPSYSRERRQLPSSVRPHASARFCIDGFLRNLISGKFHENLFGNPKICWRSGVSIGPLTWRPQARLHYTWCHKSAVFELNGSRLLGWPRRCKITRTRHVVTICVHCLSLLYVQFARKRRCWIWRAGCNRSNFCCAAAV